MMGGKYCPNKALHRTAITLRFIAAGELGRYVIDTRNGSGYTKLHDSELQAQGPQTLLRNGKDFGSPGPTREKTPTDTRPSSCFKATERHESSRASASRT